MVRIGISVEGVTEERFVKMVLGPYLASKGIFVTAISMGGAVNLDRIKAELKKIAYSFDYVSTFYDFYGFQGKAGNESKNTLEQRIVDSVHESVRPKLIPYVQMYEFEGLLFTSPDCIASNLKDDALVQWVESVLVEFDGDPERINNSPETAPSKRLEQNTVYRKTTHGPNIANEIGIDTLRERCAGFNAWLLKMEAITA